VSLSSERRSAGRALGTFSSLFNKKTLAIYKNFSPTGGVKGSFMTLEILTPEKKIYSGEVYGVQLPGIAGLFEVLDKHAPIVSALGNGTLKILRDKNNFSLYSIKSGFVEVLDNKATVLVEGAVEL